MLELFFKGGMLMYPLLLCSVLALALIMERGYYFFRHRLKTRFYPLFLSFVKQGDYEQTTNILADKCNPLAAFLAAGITARQKSRADLEKVLNFKGDQLLAGFHKRLHALELISNIAPLLGLLGTITGMVQVFQKVASSTVAASPSLLAGGIWEALLTTVFGLMIAIPALAAHHLFVNHLKALAFTMQQSGEELLGVLFKDEYTGASGSSGLPHLVHSPQQAGTP